MLVFYFFGTILIWSSMLSLRDGWRFLAYTRRELEKPLRDYAPFVSLIAPCRGLEAGLRENLTTFFAQNYRAYEIIFVVDDERDAAVSLIQSLRQEFADQVSSQLVVAGKAEASGQKVHNLRAAVQKISAESKVLAFVDSDARLKSNWLASLVAPLENQKIGATTGYRWFMSQKRNFASEWRSVWNASIASALGANSNKNFCWGGATAIRRETFEKIRMLDNWRGTLSDDFALMRALRTENLPIYFQPRCLTASFDDCTFRECVEFTTRQMKITRVYAAQFWKLSLIGSLLFTGVFWTGVLIVMFRALTSLSGWLPGAFVIAIFLLGAAKAWLRLEAVKLALPEHRKFLNRSQPAQLLLWTITPPLYLYNTLAAVVSRKILWRGIEYYLMSPTETVIIKSNDSFARCQTKSCNSST